MKINIFGVAVVLFGILGHVGAESKKAEKVTITKAAPVEDASPAEWKNVEGANDTVINPHESFASCLLVMDDNHRLIEWLAYHYHTLPLRRLIVMMDPRSEMNPSVVLERWSNLIDFDVWTDSDVFSQEELQDRTKVDDMTVLHRSRQRAFNVACMKKLMDEGRKWTLMTDNDEYLFINPQAWIPSDSLYLPSVEPIAMDESGAIVKFLNKVDLSDDRLHGQEWKACFPIARLQLGGIESSTAEIEKDFPVILEPSLTPNDFDTFRWRHYGMDAITGRNGVIPGKTLVDLTRIPDEHLWRLMGDPHRPIDKLCDGGNVWLPQNKSIFLANHMLGTQDHYVARKDSRFVFKAITWEKRMQIGGKITDELRPWLPAFVNEVGNDEARRLLQSAGQVQTQTHDLPRCSMNFFGLPRSFESLSLPTIVKNILLTNARYNCDVFVHFYRLDSEDEGRFNPGGALDTESVYALESIIKLVAAYAGHDAPTIRFVGETREQFDAKYSDRVNHYQKSVDPETGKLLYFPWKDQSYTPKSIDNIVMQWNSLQSSWQMMEKHQMHLGIEYERVAYFRLDSFYTWPVDIFKIDKDTYDYSNRYAVVPGFAKYPVNDRMFYGPAEAAKIWAAERFDRLENYISSNEEKGFGMHSERFVGNELLPAIRRETGYEVVENNDICFFRTRASDVVLLNDCSDVRGGAARGINEINRTTLVEDMVNRDCRTRPLDEAGRFVALDCSIPEDEFVPSLVSVRKLQASPEPSMVPTNSPSVSLSKILLSLPICGLNCEDIVSTLATNEEFTNEFKRIAAESSTGAIDRDAIVVLIEGKSDCSSCGDTIREDRRFLQDGASVAVVTIVIVFPDETEEINVPSANAFIETLQENESALNVVLELVDSASDTTTAIATKVVPPTPTGEPVSTPSPKPTKKNKKVKKGKKTNGKDEKKQKKEKKRK